MNRPSIVALVILGGGTALAHSIVQQAFPKEGAIVTAPKEVRLVLGEPVDLRFSTFKVYPLGSVTTDLAATNAAEALQARVITLKNDAAKRADLGLSARDGAASRIALPLKANLKPGAYAVLWRVLSLDGHTSNGTYVFRVK